MLNDEIIKNINFKKEKKKNQANVKESHKPWLISQTRNP